MKFCLRGGTVLYTVVYNSESLQTSKNTISCTSDNLSFIWVSYWWLILFNPLSYWSESSSEIDLTHCDILPPQEGNMILFGCLKASVDLMGRYYTLCMSYPWYRVFQKPWWIFVSTWGLGQLWETRHCCPSQLTHHKTSLRESQSTTNFPLSWTFEQNNLPEYLNVIIIQ